MGFDLVDYGEVFGEGDQVQEGLLGEIRHADRTAEAELLALLELFPDLVNRQVVQLLFLRAGLLALGGRGRGQGGAACVVQNQQIDVGELEI